MAALSAGLAAFACQARQAREVLTTLDGTIVLGGQGQLVFGPGEPYQVRTELAEAQAGREARRRSLVVFYNFSDAQLLDEESPLRSEWFDACPDPISTFAFRPQEALTAQVTNSAIRQANRIKRSPVSGRPVDFAVHTGDAVDNAQFNELRWFIDLMDGGKLVSADSGGPGYQGVQTESPLPQFAELLESAQSPFLAEGLKVPWYAVIGNHDVLAQGNFPPSRQANQIATGDSKVIDFSPERKEEVCQDPSVLLDPDVSAEILSDPQTQILKVPADPDRRLLSRREWIGEHFKTRVWPGPVGHGFSAENVEKDIGYYVFDHGPLRFIVLDTSSPGGFAAGSLDAQQFQWLEQQLMASSSRYFDKEGRPKETKNEDRLIVILSHHGRDAMNNPLPDPAAPDEPRLLGEDLEGLLHRFPNVILHAAGHTHQNRVWARQDPSGRTAGYWELNTSAHIDFPMQSRLVEITDNGDGTLSIFATMFDIAAPLDPKGAKDPTPEDGVNEERLAAIARQVAVGDPQLDAANRGLAASDRNVELLLSAPFDLSQVPTPPPHRQISGGARALLPLKRRDFLGLVASSLLRLATGGLPFP